MASLRWLFLAALSAVGTAGLTATALTGRLSPGDAWVRDLILVNRWAPLEQAMLALSWLGSEYAIPALLVVLWLALRPRHRSVALWVVGVAATSTIWQIALKALVGRPRPEPVLYPVWIGAGFPSGHVLTALVLPYMLWWAAGVLEWPERLRRALGWLVVIYPALMGFSRIYLNCHYLSDVVAGMLLGLLHLGLAFGLRAALARRGAGLGPTPAG